MSVCPECGRVYDESEGGCPWCEDFYKMPRKKIYYRKKKKEVQNIEKKNK